jgi:hypothetical protein
LFYWHWTLPFKSLFSIHFASYEILQVWLVFAGTLTIFLRKPNECPWDERWSAEAPGIYGSMDRIPSLDADH